MLAIEKHKEDFLNFVENYENFIILGHADPDADCICSQVVLARYLAKKGKKISLVNEGPFKRPEIMQFKDEFKDRAPTEWVSGDQKSGTAVMVVDCSTLDRIGTDVELLKELPFCMLDHHSSGDPFGKVEIIDASIPATTLIIYEVGKWLGLEPTQEEAEWLFTGFATDTGFFRHLDMGSSVWVERVSEILSFGVSPRALYQRLNYTRSIGFVGFVELMLSRVKSYRRDTILTTYEVKEERPEGQGASDSDFVYQVLMMVESAEVVAFIKESQSEQKLTVSLRSKKTMDVGSFAQRHYGGGGHRNASGFAVPLSKMSLKELEQDIVAKLEADWV